MLDQTAALVTLTLLAAVLTGTPLTVPIDTTLAVVDKLQQRFQIQCVFLLTPYTGGIGDIYGLPLYRTLARRGVSLAVASYDLFIHRRWGIKCTSRPLFVLSDPHHDHTEWMLQNLSENIQWGLTGVRVDAWRRIPPHGSPLWLLLADDVLTHHYFQRINIPFDCLFLVLMPDGRLVEIYKVEEPFRKENPWWRRGGRFPLHLYVVGSWTRSHGFWWDSRPLYERRSDLMKTSIKTAAVHKYPFTLVTWNGRSVEVDGLVGRAWRILEKKMNFTTEWIPAPAKDMLSVGEYVYQRHIDIALFDNSLTYRIRRQLDFTAPLYTSSYQVYIRHPDSSARDWSSYVAPFTPRLWLAIIVLVAVLAAVPAALHGRGRGFLPSESASYSLPYSLFCALAALFQQAHPAPPRRLSTRIGHLSAYLMSAVLLAAFSARLIASLATHQVNLPFTDLEGLLADGSYTFGTVFGSDAFMILVMAKDNTLSTLYRRGISNNTYDPEILPLTIEEGLHKVCTKRYALMLQRDFALAYANNLSCDIVALPGFSIPVSVGIITTKNNPYLGLFNYNIQKLKRGGVLKKLFDDACPSRLPAVSRPPLSVGFCSVKPLLVTLATSMALGLLLLLLEIAILSRKQKH